MTAPEARPGGVDGNARGLIVLVVAVAVGLLLLLNAGSDDGGAETAGNEESSAPDTTAPLDSSEPTESSTTTTTTAPTSGRAPGEVKALVLNGGGPAGSAAATSATIGEAGYVMGEPGNAPITVEATTFFYAEEYEEDATAIALLLGKSPDAVEPLADAGLGGAEGDSNVVVVLGPDIPAVPTN